MRHRSTRSRLSRRATSPVMVPGGRRRSRIPIPAVIALVSALLAGLAVVLAPSAPQAGAQPVAPAPEGFVEGGHPCETVVTYRKYERVYYKDVFLYSDHLGNSPSGTATYRFHVRHFYSTGGDWVVMPPPNQSSHICYDHPVPTPRRSAAGPIVDPPLIVGGALLIPGDGSGS